jgi:4-hydroxybenzoate polyprenyltransferase
MTIKQSNNLWWKASKKIISTLTILTIVPVYILVDVYDVGAMEIYFYLV